MHAKSTRRQFLAAASAGAAMSLTAASYAKVVGANERIGPGPDRLRRPRLPRPTCRASISTTRSRTSNSSPSAIRGVPGVSVPPPNARNGTAGPARQFVSYREILDLKDVDAVDDRLLRPPPRNPPGSGRQGQEGRLLRETARHGHGIPQPLLRRGQGGVGSLPRWAPQVRSWSTSTGCRELFKSGAIGKVSRIEQCRNSTKPYWYSWMQRAEPIREEDVDWKEFLMGCPMRPFDGKLLTGWYGYREFSDGPIAKPWLPLHRSVQLHRWHDASRELRGPGRYVHLGR